MPIYATEHLTNNEAAFYNEQEAAISQNVARLENIRGIDTAKPKMEARKGNFTASNISRLLAGGTGSTRMSYILEVALASIGIEDGFESAATRHGTNNQYNAFDLCVKPLFEKAEWYDKYIPLTANSGASPDILIDNYFTLDVKCPYGIPNYIEQCKKLPKKYYQQAMMQMMCTKAPVGYVLIYLTKPELWGEDNWKEYPLTVNERYHLHEIQWHDQTVYEITEAVEKAVPVRDALIDRLKAAKVLDEMDFFRQQMKNYCYRPIKEAAKILEHDFFRVNDEFYYKVK